MELCSWSKARSWMIRLMSTHLEKLPRDWCNLLGCRTVIAQLRYQWRLTPRTLTKDLLANLKTKELSNRRRHGIAELPAYRGFSALNLPVVGKALQPRDLG